MKYLIYQCGEKLFALDSSEVVEVILSTQVKLHYGLEQNNIIGSFLYRSRNIYLYNYLFDLPFVENFILIVKRNGIECAFYVSNLVQLIDLNEEEIEKVVYKNQESSRSILGIFSYGNQEIEILDVFEVLQLRNVPSVVNKNNQEVSSQVSYRRL